MVKKGTAMVVMKPNAKAYSCSKDEDGISKGEDNVSGKPKRKGRGNFTAASGRAMAAAKAFLTYLPILQRLCNGPLAGHRC